MELLGKLDQERVCFWLLFFKNCLTQLDNYQLMELFHMLSKNLLSFQTQSKTIFFLAKYLINLCTKEQLICLA